MSFSFKKVSAIMLCALLTAQMLFFNAAYASAEETQAVSGIRLDRKAYYSEVRADYPEYSSEDEISFLAADAVLNSGAVIKEDKGLLSDLSEPELSFELNIPSSGIYNIAVDYKIAGGASSSDAVRSLKINGAVPFAEAERILFTRSFADDGEIGLNTAGDEIRPSVKEIRERRTTFLYDSGGFYSEPLEFLFESGKQTLTLSYVSCDIYIYSITLTPVKVTPSYAELSAQYGNTAIAKGVEEIYQAEASMSERSDSSIRMESNSDPAAVPQAKGYKKLNVVGGYRWREGNQRITYSFNIAQTGYYKFSIRYLQNWNDGLPSYRRIEIDGEVPCKELQEYRFEYGDTWATETLKSTKGDMLFYLEKGIHTLTMTVVLGELSEIVQKVYDNMLIVSDMVQSINKLTGGDADPNYDYEFFKNIPNLKQDMQTVSNGLSELAQNLDSITSKSTSMSGNFRSISSQLNKMINNPFSIAKRVDQFTSAQTNLGTYYSSMQLLPLMMDEFSVASPEKEVKARKASIFQKIGTACYNFLISFSKDYNGVAGTLSGDTQITEIIDVWVARGTEWTEAIKYLADSEFTPKTGILVNMNVVPSSQLNTGSANVLLLSLVSGTAPDAAMGVSANSPVEFAIRNAVCDLSLFEDFKEVSGRFIEKIFIPLTYNGGIYALPETMNFNCLFYRKDIFSKYSFRLPDTWNDLYYDLLPALYQNGMGFYMPQDFTTFLYQNGGSFYSEDGLYSNLGTNEAYMAFKQYTEMFTNYGSPVSANFLTRFRTGEMPVGIGSFQFYIQLCTAAPELVGNWEIAPLPGTVKENGSVDRSTGGLASECDIILAKNSKKAAAAWEFLKWWSDTDTQITYADELESLIGVEARWNSANAEAFSSLDWSVNDRKVIEEMWQWAAETPVVLGGYYTTRYINNAFNSVVVSGNLSVRDALEEAVEAIDRELKSKQAEYGVMRGD